MLILDSIIKIKNTDERLAQDIVLLMGRKLVKEVDTPSDQIFEGKKI